MHVLNACCNFKIWIFEYSNVFEYSNNFRDSNIVLRGLEYYSHILVFNYSPSYTSIENNANRMIPTFQKFG